MTHWELMDKFLYEAATRYEGTCGEEPNRAALWAAVCCFFINNFCEVDRHGKDVQKKIR